MKEISELAKICMNYSFVNTIITKKLDRKLSAHGINFTEFMVLFHLEQFEEKMIRRIDLAEKIGLSPSGITRLIIPMEKIGLVQKEPNSRDARVSLVKISSSGERVLNEASISLYDAAQEIFSILSETNTKKLSQILNILGGKVK